MRRTLTLCALAVWIGAGFAIARGEPAADPASTTIYHVKHPLGLMATTGGWAYCEQLRPIARRTGYTLLCGQYS